MRFLLPSLLLLGGVLVLFAGALGGHSAWPDNTSSYVQTARSGMTSSATATTTSQVASPTAATETMQRQINELQNQLAQRAQELAELRASQDETQRKISALHEQSATIERTKQPDRDSAPQKPTTPVASSQRRMPSSEAAVITRLRQQEKPTETTPPPSAQPGQPVQAQTDSGGEPSPVALVPQRDVPPGTAAISAVSDLMSARQSVASGNWPNARRLLLQARSALAGSVASGPVHAALRLLDQGDVDGAMYQLNNAMDRLSAQPSGGQATALSQPVVPLPAPPPIPGYSYLPPPTPYYGYSQR